MNSKTWFILPLAIRLSSVYLLEDTALDGDLQEVYAPLVKNYISFKKNEDLKAKISKTYLKGESLWTVTSDIMETFHLIPILNVGEDGAFSMTFNKGSAWKEG